MHFIYVDSRLKLYWVDQLLFALTTGLTKLSICLSYLRIFPGKGDRMFSYLTIVVLIVYTLIALGLTLFQCFPVEKFWESRASPDSCINILAVML